MSRERELIKRATEALKFWMDETAYSVDWELLEDLESYLASEKQDQPEPVAWLYSKGDVLAGVPVIFTSATTGKDFAFQKPHYDQKPLFLHPSPQAEQRKLLSKEDLEAGWKSYRMTRLDIYLEQRSFVAGIRFAEKHHGIGGGDE